MAFIFFENFLQLFQMTPSSSSPMRRLFQYMRPERKLLGWSVFASICNKVIDLMPPLIVGWAIDAVNGQTPAWIAETFEVGTATSLALFFGLLIVVVFAFESLFEWLLSLGFLNLAQRVQHRLRLDAYSHLQKREMAYFEQQRAGNILSILNDDINQLERFLNNSFNQIVQLLTLYVFAILTMGSISWKLTLISLFPIPLIVIGSFFYQKRIAPFYKKIREAVGELSSRLENNLGGIVVIKSFTAENYESERVREASAAYLEANERAIQWNAAYIPLIRMLIALGFGTGMFIGAYWVLTGQEGFTAGALTFFGMMIQRILWPITNLGRVFDEFERAKASARRVFELMDVHNPLLEKVSTQKTTIGQGNLSLEKLHFHYQEKQPIIRGLSLAIPAGQRIGIAGTTGSGKTTLIKLLLRLYDVQGGAIRLDGKDIREIAPQLLRQHIGLVSQEVYLFHGSIRENIAYGMGDVPESEIIRVAQMAELHDFVAQLPEGYDSMVGERGIKLSGGQRQRLSIARALLKNAPILILDEATSAVDTETERAIQKNLHQLTEDKTAIIIAHRLSTIRQCDQIVVLKAGQIAEQGQHDELLAKEGLYSDLWRVQTGDLLAN